MCAFLLAQRHTDPLGAPVRADQPTPGAPVWSPRALLVVLALVLLVPALPARADDTTYRNLLQRALAVLQEAEAHYHAGRRPQARESALRARTLVVQADRLKPRDVSTAFLAIQACVFAGDREQAALWLQRYRSRTPYGERDPNLQYAHAMVWLMLEDRPGHAVRVLEALFDAAPHARTAKHDVLYYAALMADGGDLVRARQVDEALDRFRRAAATARRTRQRRKEIAARANAGIALVQLGRPAEAARVFEALKREEPSALLWSWYLGLALRDAKRHGEALPLFEAVADAVDKGRAPAPHRKMLVGAHLALGRSLRAHARRTATDPESRGKAYRAARAAFERYVALEPKSAEGWHRLGRLLYEDLAAPYEAIEPLERAYRLDPACDGALRLLIRIAARHAPPPAEDPEATADAVEAWDARRAAWERQMEENAEAWEAERLRRRQQDPLGHDGCP